MTALQVFHGFLILMAVMAAVVCGALFFVDAGYGQYIDRRWGYAINNKVGWLIMEMPVVILFATVFRRAILTP